MNVKTNTDWIVVKSNLSILSCQHRQRWRHIRRVGIRAILWRHATITRDFAFGIVLLHEGMNPLLILFSTTMNYLMSAFGDKAIRQSVGFLFGCRWHTIWFVFRAFCDRRATGVGYRKTLVSQCTVPFPLIFNLKCVGNIFKLALRNCIQKIQSKFQYTPFHDDWIIMPLFPLLWGTKASSVPVLIGLGANHSFWKKELLNFAFSRRDFSTNFLLEVFRFSSRTWTRILR